MSAWNLQLGTDLALSFHTYLAEFSTQGMSPDLWVPMLKTHVSLQVAHNVHTLLERENQPWYPHCPPAVVREVLRKSTPMPGAGVDLERFFRNWTATFQRVDSLAPSDAPDRKSTLAGLFQSIQATNLLVREKVAIGWDQFVELSGFVRTPEGARIFSFRIVCPWKPLEGVGAIPLKEDNMLLGKPATEGTAPPPVGTNQSLGEIDEAAEREAPPTAEEEYGAAASTAGTKKTGSKKRVKLTDEERKKRNQE